MYGSKCKGGLRAEISEVLKHINMDDPAPLGRYLEVNHRRSVWGPQGKKTTEVEFDVLDFFRAKCKAYKADTGKTLRKVDSPLRQRSTTSPSIRTWQPKAS